MSSTSSDQQRLQSLITLLMKQRPEFSKESVSHLIEEKKGKVGGGYLTDQGALFLVAADLGVALNYNHATSMKLADVSPEMPNLSVLAKVLTVSPIKVFTRKTDAKQGLLSRLVVYDNTSTLAVNLWDSKASVSLAGSGIRPGDLIKISNAYTRMGIDGSLIINVGEKGNVEKIPEEESPEIQPIERRAIPPELVLEPARFLVVKGKVRGRARQSTFSRSDGSSGNMVSFSLASPQENSNGAEMRVVIWENTNPSFLSFRDGEQITLLNLRAKTGRRPGEAGLEGALELHGDESTCALEYWEETIHWIKKSAEGIADMSNLSRSGQSTSLLLNKSPQIKATEPIPLIARILSIGQKSPDGSSVRLLLLDSQKRKLSVTITKDCVLDTIALNVDDVVVCKPDSIDYLGLKAGCSKKGGLVKTASKREDIPKSDSLVTKIDGLEEATVVSLDVMSLGESVSREVQTKDGLVRRSELSLGDPTGEIRLYGWRDLSKMIEKIPAGERLWLYAVECQSHDGRKFLNLKNYSRVVRNNAI